MKLIFAYLTTGLTAPHLNQSVMFSYDTVSEAINDLKKRGYVVDFNLEADGLSGHVMPALLKAAEFDITEVYRFEGNSDPDDEAIVYAIESKHGLKGILVNGFGISADSVSDDMIEKLKLKYQGPGSAPLTIK